MLVSFLGAVLPSKTVPAEARGPWGRCWNSPSFLEEARGGEVVGAGGLQALLTAKGPLLGPLSGHVPGASEVPLQDAKQCPGSEAQLPHACPPAGPCTAWEREARPADTHTGRELQAGTQACGLEDGLLTGGEQPRNPARPQPGWEQLRQKALS